jgi:hypothetical protein
MCGKLIGLTVPGCNLLDYNWLLARLAHRGGALWGFSRVGAIAVLIDRAPGVLRNTLLNAGLFDLDFLPWCHDYFFSKGVHFAALTI